MSTLLAPVVHKKIMEALNESIIPSLRHSESIAMVLAELPAVVPDDVIVRHLSHPLLPDAPFTTLKQSIFFWPEARLNSVNCPYLGFVFEGEVDLALGGTVGMVQRLSPQLRESDWGKHGYHVLQVKAPAFVFFPAGTPQSSGAGKHWERPHPEQANSKILWLHVVTDGVFCHMCETNSGEHMAHHSLFIGEKTIGKLTEILEEELRERGLHQQIIAHGYLVSLILSLHRRLKADPPVLMTAAWPQATHTSFNTREPGGPHPAMPPVIEQADAFIQAHLHESISVPQVAHHCSISARQLNRLFRSNLDTTVSEFIDQQKMAAAQQMLTSNKFTVKEISGLLGFSQASHFCRRFQQMTHMTPSLYRKQTSSHQP